MAAGPHLDLRRPAQAGQQIGHVQRHAGEARHGAREGHRPLRPHAVEQRCRPPGSAWRGCSAPTAPPARRRAAPAGRHSGRTARRWRRACRTGWRRCRRHRCRARISPRRARPRRSRAGTTGRRTPAGRSARAPPGCRSRSRRRRLRQRLLPGGEFGAVRVVQPQPQPHRRRRRSPPSNWRRRGATTCPRRRGRRRSWWRNSSGRGSAPVLVSIASGSRASSSVSTAVPAGSMARMRAATRPASKAAISTVPASAARQFGQRPYGQAGAVGADLRHVVGVQAAPGPADRDTAPAAPRRCRPGRRARPDPASRSYRRPIASAASGCASAL